MPVDIAQAGIRLDAFLSFKRYIRAETDGFVVGSAGDACSRLTSPRARQK